jgi:hypothetical protein
MSIDKARVKERFVQETKDYLMLFVYLAAFLGSFTIYKRLVLQEHNLSYYHYGYSLFEAAILAKVILLGDWLGLGKGNPRGPLILAALRQTFLCSLLVIVFSFLEKIVDGLLHGHGLAWGVDAVLSMRKQDVLANFLMLYVTLTPLFAVRQLEKTLGPGRLFALFFKGRAD